MVIGAFPAAKLGALLLKHISKPIANIVKDRARESPTFRKYVCMPPAQFYNWCEVSLKMWILHLGKPVNIPVLNEAMAIELGSNLIGEGIIFVIAAAILVSEYNRSSRKEAATQEKKRQEMSEIQSALQELFLRTEEHAANIRHLSRQIGDLDTRIGGNKNRRPTPPPETPADPNCSSDDVPNSSSDNKPVKDTTQSTIRHFDPLLLGNSNKPSGQPSLILRAVNDVEQQFWEHPFIEREDNLLMLGLIYVNKLFRFQQ